MCGIAGILSFKSERYNNLEAHLRVMNRIQAHRGPDGEGLWTHKGGRLGFAHRRLSIIDLTTGAQPMSAASGDTICYNGEIYNYMELRQELGNEFDFRTTSDTEVILAAYRKWGTDCVNHLRGMFAFAVWDESEGVLFCARDRFGIKPFYYTVINDVFYFASEPKTLLPFLPAIETDIAALKDYLVFQFCLDGKTLFQGINELQPAHRLIIRGGNMRVERYWEVYYNLDFYHTPRYFEDKLRALIEDSVKYHIVSDVPVGAYVSGGTDSSIVASVASRLKPDEEFMAFTGKFLYGELYDESAYARALTEMRGMTLHETAITSRDFADSIRKVIHHLDYPVAGPGSFPQYHVSKLAAQHRKVVLGGQGGDETFGGYTRYLVAYFEQCIKAAVNGTTHSGRFVVTYESIIPNLVALKNYKPMLQEFWKEGLFEDMDKRYYRLINRAPTLHNEINLHELGEYSPFETFKGIFNGHNVNKESYFDRMTHFDFKTLLPALLQVEDRMSMAHGLESRVPFLDHPLVEFAATMPADVKFKDGTLKMALTNAMRQELPDIIANRKNKMGFPVPLNEWIKGELKEFVFDVFNAQPARNRAYFNHKEILNNLTSESNFGRKIWGLLSLELWHQEFHDKAHKYKQYLNKEVLV
ncbi:MAG: asparagine synthase (glutamine-hydrolyzing) [Nitrospirae bacterium]|nr:asparagine synthase (glutamine-hydrolyzing) [Nitrospirota bacterium]